MAMSIQERMAELNNLLQSYIFYAILPNNLKKKRNLILHFNISRPYHFPYPTRCGRVRNDITAARGEGEHGSAHHEDASPYFHCFHFCLFSFLLLIT